MEQFKFEVRNMGIHFYIPIVICFAVLIVLITLPQETYILQQFVVIQTFIIPLSAWCTAFLVYELYHHHAEEVLIKLYSKKLIQNYIKVITIFLLIITILSTVLGVKSEALHPMNLGLLLVSQTLIFSSISLFLAVYFKNVETSLMLVIMYVATELITMGELMPWPHLFYFNPNVQLEDVLAYGIVSIVSSVIFIMASHSVVKTVERSVI
ncbi:hypothetical protein BAMA_24495 [Bacillus manliponensis]|uniref:Uncharacterized protein n=1 Tax=Bacillus manliponensis TaxID=574376 RepID=A0A073JY59_9BACI|nr:hypothetical protein [Bacillus manliponensis]KEK19167.1 hypothetical protein BAMA_24495 [Bacillus manliponensis]